MKWRIAANGVALVVVISAASISSAAGFDTQLSQGSQRKFVAEDARSVLSTIKIENEYKTGYKRSLFIHWADLNGDGCDTREEILKRDSTSKPQVDPYRCYVVAGDWVSPYDGARLSDRGDVDIDHVVALKEAWDSGAWAWSESQRKAYANDMTDRRTLIAVTDRVNVSKSDKDPSNWMPPLRSYWCTYLGDWISVKARWGLSMDQSEFGRISNLLASDCASLTIASWSAAPVLVAVPITVPAITITTSTVTTSTAATSSTTTSSTVATSSTVTTSTTVPSSTATSATTSSTSTAPASAEAKDISPGSYCAPVDGLGSYKSLVYICSKTSADGTPYSGNRARWRKLAN
ncbi:MAG: HNH endonuclease family protein [Actinobacteria bacterium]|nr:HNH endonuclease family protein [Actinomycetota bacterium]